MIAVHPSRRSAERFAALVDAGPAPTSPASSNGPSADLLALVGALRAVPQVHPRAEFSGSLRERLLLAANAEPATAIGTAPAKGQQFDRRLAAPPSARRPRERRIAVGLAAVAIVGASSSMAVAAQSANPGDALYPLKRAIEDAHAQLSVGDQAQGTILLGSASDRLAEVGSMTADGDGSPAQVTTTLNLFTSQFSRGAQLLMRDYRQHGATESIDVLRRFDSESMLTLSALDGTISEASEPALLAAAQQLFRTDAEAGQLCATCSEAGITEFPATLLASGTDPLFPATTVTSAGGAIQVGSTLGGAGGSGGSGHQGPHTRASDHPTALPSATASVSVGVSASVSVSIGPSQGPSSRPSDGPSQDPSQGPSDDPSQSPTDEPSPTDSDSPQDTPSDSPSDDPVVTDLPSVVDVASDVASQVADSVDGLLGNLLGNLGLAGSQPDQTGQPDGS